MNDDFAPGRLPQPGVVTWFKVYCGALCLLYLATAAASLIFFLVDPVDLEMSPVEARVVGGLLLVMGLGFFVVCALPLVCRPRPWLWTYDLVVICLGMTSACCIPICIPLLIFWTKPEVKEFFRQTAAEEGIFQ